MRNPVIGLGGDNAKGVATNKREASISRTDVSREKVGRINSHDYSQRTKEAAAGVQEMV